jgi:hypothetical protein
MNDTDSRETKNSGAQKWVDTWIHAGDALEKIRRSDVKLADTAEALRSFTGSVLHVLRTRPAAQTSGLVEQQRIFRKFRAS